MGKRSKRSGGKKSAAGAAAAAAAAASGPAARVKQSKKAAASKQQPKQQPKQQQRQQQAKSKKKGSGGLSEMQAEMRRRLDGGKFRMLNEQLYTSSGDQAFETFQSDPALFDVYHQGFREQADKWPVNPLDTFIDFVKRRPKAVVADFGCGDARLAESVSNTVHSFDLVSRKPLVTACNIADVPLADATVDIAVYCLALMGTTIREYVMEAHRVLKPRGVLKVAEVKSRFETESLGGIDGFVEAMHKLGFDCKQRDEKNKMFVLFEFAKSNRKPQSDVTIEFKACEYKRR